MTRRKEKTGKNGGYEIVAGHRRFTAATAAGLKEMPAIVKELSDEEALEIQVIENSHREDPNPMDEAWGFKRLIAMGKHTPDTLAGKIGHPVPYVLMRLKLIDLDKAVQEKIASGAVGLGLAILFTRLRNPEDQKEFLKLVINERTCSCWKSWHDCCPAGFKKDGRISHEVEGTDKNCEKIKKLFTRY